MSTDGETPEHTHTEAGASPRTVRTRRRLIIGLAVVAILGALAIGAHIGWFYLRSDTKGAALKNQYHRQVSQVQSGQLSCPAFNDSESGPQGLVEAPAIGLSAPVEAGDDDSVLNVAVGHISGSVWPSQPGTTLLAAHDVSYFSQIDKLQVGQTVTFASACTKYVYQVTGHQIVAAGSPLYSSASQSLLVLETCYPLNALFITSQRYLVTAQLKRDVQTVTSVPASLVAPPAPAVPAPAPLAAQGLTLDQNDVQLGELQFAGTPGISWQESPVPLSDEAAALADYFAGLRTAEQTEATWWTELAPAVPFTASQPLQGAHVSYQGSLTPTLEATGSTLTGADIDVGVSVSGGSAPGRYSLHVHETVTNNTLVITQWSLTPG